MAWIPSNETRAKKRLLFLAPSLVALEKGEKRGRRKEKRKKSFVFALTVITTNQDVHRERYRERDTPVTVTLCN